MSEPDDAPHWSDYPEISTSISGGMVTMSLADYKKLCLAAAALRDSGGAARAPSERDRIAAAMFAADDEASDGHTWESLHPQFRKYWQKLADAALAALRSAAPAEPKQPRDSWREEYLRERAAFAAAIRETFPEHYDVGLPSNSEDVFVMARRLLRSAAPATAGDGEEPAG